MWFNGMGDIAWGNMCWDQAILAVLAWSWPGSYRIG